MFFVFRSELAVASSDFCFSLGLNPGLVFNSVYILLKKKHRYSNYDSLGYFTRQIMISLESERDF